MQTESVFVGNLKYIGDDDRPAFVEDTMLISKDAIEAYAIIHLGGKENDDEEH